MTRRVRLSAAVLALVAMLFASIATALAACERMPGMPAAEGAAAASHLGGFEDPDCERHCNAAQPLDLAKPLPAAISVLAPVAAFQRPLDRAVLLRAPLPRAPAFLADPSPPLTRFTVLRL
jgi:hypothetical protein